MTSDTAEDNRVLMITYAFPPTGYVGVHRTLKYCKYLHDYAWTPIVLTIDPTAVAHKDEQLCHQIPDHVSVHRTRDIDPAKWLARRARQKERGAVILSPAAAPADASPTEYKPGTFRRIKKLLHTLLTGSPDSHVFWIPFALVRGVGILLRQKVDIIYSSSPPHSTHIVAFLLGKIFRKPYVLDFRDPWHTEASARRPIMEYPWLWKLEIAVKGAIVRGAARVIGVTRGERDELRAEFPDLEDDHFKVITNGYDPADFSGVRANREAPKRNKLILTHAGTIYRSVGREFFEALHLLLRRHPGVEHHVQVNLLGEMSDEYADSVRALEAAGIVKNYGLQPHATALGVILDSDVLLILMGGDLLRSSHIPAKVFEYFYVGKPILAVAKEGELTQIARTSGLGIIADPESIDGLEQTLWKLHLDHAAGRLAATANQAYIQSFERAVLAERLATILNEVKDANRGSTRAMGAG